MNAGGGGHSLVVSGSVVTSDTSMEETVSTLRTTQLPIYEALVDTGPMTDEQLQDTLDLPANKMCPRRLELVKMGLVEQVGQATTRSGNMAKLWKVVPVERIEEAREAASARKPRRKTVQDLPLDQQVTIARLLLKDDKVNAALMELQGRAGERARGRARGAKSEAERERRDLKTRIEEAEREQSALRHFLKALRNLRNSEGVVRSVREFVFMHTERNRRYGQALIPEPQLPELRAALSDVIDLAEDARRELDVELDVEYNDDVIEGEAVDISDLELPGDVAP